MSDTQGVGIVPLPSRSSMNSTPPLAIIRRNVTFIKAGNLGCSNPLRIPSLALQLSGRDINAIDDLFLPSLRL